MQGIIKEGGNCVKASASLRALISKKAVLWENKGREGLQLQHPSHNAKRTRNCQTHTPKGSKLLAEIFKVAQQSSKYIRIRRCCLKNKMEEGLGTACLYFVTW